MKTLFTRPLAYGLVAFGLLAGTAAPSQAGPLPQTQLQVPTTTNAVTPVRDSWAGGGPRSQDQVWRWRNRDRGWRHDRQWRGDWGDRRWHNDRWRGDGWRYRRHYRDNYIGLGGFGLGLGLGLAAPRYYDEYYVPRRTYRTYRGLSSAHVRWCSARYRTYRAWDNTYVPRLGYRAICRSPYG